MFPRRILPVLLLLISVTPLRASARCLHLHTAPAEGCGGCLS